MDSDFDIASALLLRRDAGDTTPITYREAKALREMRRRATVVRVELESEFRRLGFEEVTLSPYMQALMRLGECADAPWGVRRCFERG